MYARNQRLLLCVLCEGDGQPAPLTQERVHMWAELIPPPLQTQISQVADRQAGAMTQEKGLGAELTPPPFETPISQVADRQAVVMAQDLNIN